HVFSGVDGDVDLPREKRFLDLLDEDAARADLAEGLRAVLVSRGRDRNERDLDALAAQPLGRELGLGQREAATPAADPDQHRNGLVERRSSSGCDGRSEARTQGASIAKAIGATEDAASERAARPDGTDYVSPGPCNPNRCRTA